MSAGTLKDAAGNDVVMAIPSGANLNDSKTFVVDGSAPADFTVGTVVATAGVVVTDYYNASNDGVSVTITIPSDPSLQNGEIQILGSVAANALENVGDPSEIIILNTDKVITLTSAELEGLTGFGENLTLTFNAIMTDSVGNSTTGTASANILTVDEVVPQLTSVEADVLSDQLSIGETSDITFTFSEDVTLAGGNIVATLETGDADAQITRTTLNATNSFTETYTVIADEASLDLNVSSIALTTGSLRDAAGNDVIATGLELTLPAGENLADNNTLLVDGIIPTITSITSTSDDSEYWSEGESIEVTVTFSEPVVLTGAGGLDPIFDAAARIIPAHSVTDDTTIVITYTVADGDASSDLSLTTPLELTVGTLLHDPAGNNVDLNIPGGENLNDNYTFYVDGTAPAPFVVGEVIATNSTITTDYLNFNNDGVRVTVPIASDLSLQNGYVQIRARVGANPFEDIGSPSLILGVGSDKDVPINIADIVTLTGYAEDNVNLIFTAVISDLVGNSTTGTASTNIIAVDRVVPELSTIASSPVSDELSIGETADITFDFSENVTLAGGNLVLSFDTGAEITVTSLSDAVNFTETYTVLADEVSADLDVSSVALSAGSLRDAAGNDVTATLLELTLPTGSNLADNSGLVVDGVVPDIASISSVTTSDSLGIGETITIDVEFSEAVTLSGGNLFLTLETGDLVADQQLEITPFTEQTIVSVDYIVQVDHESLDLTVTDIQLPVGTLIDPSGNGVDYSVPTTTNLADMNALLVDGIVPDDFTTGDIVTLAAPIVEDYWNLSNTSLEVIIPVPGISDASMDGGTTYLEARVDGNPFVTIGNVTDFGTNPVTMGLDRADLETLAGYLAGNTLEVRGVKTDIAGNTTIGASSSNTLTIDITAPNVSIVGNITAQGGTVIVPGYFNAENTTVLVSTQIANDASMLNGQIQLQADIDGLDSWVNVGLDSTVTILDAPHTITLDLADLTAIGAGDGETVTFRAVLTDIAQNTTTGTQGVNSLIIDTTLPTVVTVEDPVAVGDPIVANYFNIGNSGLDVTIPIETDATLIGGNIKFRSYVDGVSQSIYGALDIVDYSPLTQSIPRLSLESMADYAENVEITFDALITDAAGNETTATLNPNPVIVDQIAPLANAFDVIDPQNGIVKAGYWNASNDSILITVDLDETDVSIANGTITVAADLVPGNGVFETFAKLDTIPGLLDFRSIIIPGSQIEGLDGGVGFLDGLDIHFQTIITDAAGNAATSPTSLTTLEIDQTPPTVPVITDTEVRSINFPGSMRDGIWNARTDTLLIDLPLNTVADPTLVGGFYEVLMSVGGTFDENSYVQVGDAEYSIPADDTLRFGSADLSSLTFVDLDSLFTRITIQDRAGNEIITATSDERIYIDIGPPIDFACGPLTANSGNIVENAYNNSNNGISLEVPIDNDDGLLNGQAIILVSFTDLEVDPFAATNFIEVDSVTINAVDETLIMTLDDAKLSEYPDFKHNVRMDVTAILQDYAGNEIQGAPSPNSLYIDYAGPELPVLNDTTTTGGNIVEGYWNASNSGISLLVNTPAVADTTLEGGYIQLLGAIGASSFVALGDSVPIVSRNFTELSANVDSSIIEHLVGFGDHLPLHIRVKLVDGRGNDTSGVRMDTLFWIDQISPTLGTYDPDSTTTDLYITSNDTLKAQWDGFADAGPLTDIAYYDYSIGHSEGVDDFLPWGTLLGTQLDTLMSYAHEDEYYLNVRAVDDAGNVSDILSSPVITADLNVPTSVSLMDRFYFIEDWPDLLNGTYSDDLSGMNSMALTLQRQSDELFWDGSLWHATDTTQIELIIDAGVWDYTMLSDSLTNREEYVISLFGVDAAGNEENPWLSPLNVNPDTFQFVINTAPEFVLNGVIDSTSEDSLYSNFLEAIDPDVGSISADTLYWSIGLNPTPPAGVLIDSLTGELTWLPVDSAVGTHIIRAYVEDFYGESDSILIDLKVLELNDAPEPVTLLLPTDSTQLVAADSLLLTFTWSAAFDIEDNPVDYTVTMQGTGYDTTIAAPDTFLTVDVSVMDFPNGLIGWFVKAYDQEDTSAVADTFHVASSPAFAELNTDTLDVRLKRYATLDTTLTIRNLGLTDLRWSYVDGPDWLSLVSENGITEYQDSSIVALRIRPSEFTVGVFEDHFRLATNDPLKDTITVHFTLGVFDIPTPVLAFYKNPAYPGFYELMIVDSLGMTDSLSISYLGEDLEVTEIDTFSYMATIEISSPGLQSFEVVASNWLGDTTITTAVNVSLARSGSSWIARSPDEAFEMRGSSRSTLGKASVVVLDTLLSANDDARYKVLSDGIELAEPVLVSMPAGEEAQAIYILNEADEYVELPSISDAERISAWSEGLGAYKLGPRTIIVPEQSKLSQNYPNPFNPSTNIDFDIGFLDGLNQNVEFSVYNIRGQQVRTLIDKHLQPGSYSVTWNGLDDQGRQLSSGIYLARLMTGEGYVKTVKMLILR